MIKKPNDVKEITIKYGIIPPSGFLAITWFGTMYINKKNKEEWEKYSETYKRTVINHETIHLKQAQREGTWTKFYAKYLWYWIKGMFLSGFKNDIAYYCIPYEIEAYVNEGNLNYNLSKFEVYQKIPIKTFVSIKKKFKYINLFKQYISNMY